MRKRRSVLDKAKAADLRPQSVASKRLQTLFGRARNFFKRPSRHADKAVAWHIRQIDKNVGRRDWQAARDHVLALGLLGEGLGDPSLMDEAGRGLKRLTGENRAWQLIASSKRVPGRPEWDGGDLKGRTLVVERRGGDLAVFFQFASLLGPAAAAADRCIVYVEPRVAPLLRRTYPALDVRIEGEKEVSAADGNVFACLETLARYFWPDEPQVRAPFVPLEPDRTLVAELRRNYLDRGPGPLIGFAWGSLNRKKDLPALEDWRILLGKLPGRLVSLQYGDVCPALCEFERWAPGRIVHDTSVDQLSDMDRFAAQVSALDMVVTISNTGANLAGALGVPTIVMLGDRFHLMWPASGNRIAQYPAMRLIHRAGRDWSAAMNDAHREALSILSLKR